MKICCYIALFALFVLDESCNKNNPTPKVLTSDSMNLSVMYADTSKNPPANFELVVQEPGGLILLDTLAPVNLSIKATIRTSNPLINVSTVYMGTHDTAFTVTSYLGVDPSRWQTFPINNAFVVLPNAPATAMHQTLVENIPGYASIPPPQSSHYVWFSDWDILTFLPAVNAYPNSILLNGQFFGNNYLYSFIPSLGLYNFHAPNWSHGTDTVDLTHMDTMRQVNFPRPSQYGKCYCIVDGIMDTTDLSKSIMLYFSSFTPTTPDLEYPAKYVQKFQVHATFLAPDSTQVTYYSYGSGISPNFLFPDPSRYSLTSIQSNDFSIKFNNLTPTFYETQWKSGKINFYIYSAPDSNVQQPQSLLTSINSQKLKSQTITTLKPVNALFETLDAMSYASFLYNSASPSLFGTWRVGSAVRWIKNF
jgi:hypothetical protein